jgi:hypothetical protein
MFNREPMSPHPSLSLSGRMASDGSGKNLASGPNQPRFDAASLADTPAVFRPLQNVGGGDG